MMYAQMMMNIMISVMIMVYKWSLEIEKKKKEPKGIFFAPDKLENHTIKENIWKRVKERLRRTKEEEEEKPMVSLLAFILTVFWPKKKNCLKEEIYLAVTFSNIWLD